MDYFNQRELLSRINPGIRCGIDTAKASLAQDVSGTFSSINTQFLDAYLKIKNEHASDLKNL
ncbi:MAG: hypothetical protein LBG88_04640 [Christensenellaceae bacterium]|jgi:hypothetical protein|nr:hypothetical protein [Christensenellaceae bacterium]